MDPEGTGEVRSALAAFPGLAEVTVVGHDAGQAGQCLIAYVVPSGAGLDVPGLHAYARKALPGGRVPAAIVVLDEIPVTAAGTADATALPVPELGGLLPYQAPASAALGIRITIADLFKASTPGDMGRRLSLMEERK